MANEKIEKGKIGIGNKETIALKPAKVKILGYKIEMQKDKEKKDVGEKVSFMCKHPAKDDPIEISSVSYKKGKEIKTSGLWFKLDEDGLLSKNSALSQLLLHIGAINLDEVTTREIETELDDKGYLTFKAY